MIPKESIIVNGQSGDFLFGGHVPSELENACDLDQIVTYILTKHCMHWPEFLTLDTSKNCLNLYDVSWKDLVLAQVLVNEKMIY